MHQDIRKIIEAGISAPSGENSQPWRFEVENLKITLINNDESDQSLYNWDQRGSLIAHGAALENIKIASENFGYKATIELFPDTQNKHIVAHIFLEKDLNNIISSPLYAYISKRVTNRKVYKNTSLTKQELDELQRCIQSKMITLHFTDKTSDKLVLGKAGSTNEEIMLGNKYIHNFFFNHVSWNKNEDDKKRIGFFINTLELAPPAKAAFKIIKNWKIMSLFLNFNFQKLVSKQNATINSCAGAFGVLSISDLSPESFVEVGIVLERIWLTATKLGLSFQPLTGVLFFMLRINAGDREKFSANEIQIIKKAYNDITGVFNIQEKEIIPFMFRIGQSSPPSARSSRFTVDEITKIIQI